MTDRYQQFIQGPVGSQLANVLPLPAPPDLRRYEPGQDLATGPVLVGGADGPLRDRLVTELERDHVDVRTDADGDDRFHALLFDATAITSSSDLGQLHDFLHPVLKRVRPSGRVVVLGRPPEEAATPAARVAHRALEGFTRSLAKEVRDGTTVQLVYVAEGAHDAVASTLRFLVSARSAYVSGQVIRVRATPDGTAPTIDWDRPLADQVALVTGASRGIGAAIAEVLARDGAHVVCLDVPSQGDALARVANELGGTTLQLDVTADDAPERLAEHLRERHGGVDVVVHNAGITRDRSLVNMERGWWDAVLAVNLTSQERIDEVLVGEKILNEGGRIVCVSSMAGIAGGKGQTNYAASKAGVIGHVDALVDEVAARGGTINAVAPGFIETEMTAAMPLVPREFGRRMNSLSQGGLPVDVAETIAWFASPASLGVTGNVVRVDGQHLIGA